ncbi:MAG: hypothetical protein ISS69_16035 [Phycisphaerae bacterium]|nr:hypothetical protein [Phycisphaerae bacterium]
MRILILRSKPLAGDEKPTDPYSREFRSRFADRVIGNLEGDKGFCASCGPDCNQCREGYDRRFASSIAGVIELPAVLPHLLEKPAEHVPENIPDHDLVLAIRIHEQVLIEFLKRCGDFGTRGVVVPMEAHDWISHAARQQARDIAVDRGVEIDFPKPFCDFDPPAGSFLAEFRRLFCIGRPDVELAVEDGIIQRAHVRVSAACGATYFVARWLVGRSVDEDLAHEVVAKRMHSYPCTASMAWDRELSDTVMHVASKAHDDILAPLGLSAGHDSVEMIESPVGGMIPKPTEPRDSIENIERAKEAILQDLARNQSASLRDLREKRGISPSAMYSALLLLKQAETIRTEGDTIFKR